MLAKAKLNSINEKKKRRTRLDVTRKAGRSAAEGLYMERIEDRLGQWPRRPLA